METTQMFIRYCTDKMWSIYTQWNITQPQKEMKYWYTLQHGQTSKTPHWEARPEKATAPHSSTLAWKIPWTEEPWRLQSMGSLRARHDWATSLALFTFMEMATHSSVLAWRIPGTGEPGGLPSMGSHRVGHDWRDLAAAVAAAATNYIEFTLY